MPESSTAIKVSSPAVVSHACGARIRGRPHCWGNWGSLGIAWVLCTKLYSAASTRGSASSSRRAVSSWAWRLSREPMSSISGRTTARASIGPNRSVVRASTCSLAAAICDLEASSRYVTINSPETYRAPSGSRSITSGSTSRSAPGSIRLSNCCPEAGDATATPSAQIAAALPSHADVRPQAPIKPRTHRAAYTSSGRRRFRGKADQVRDPVAVLARGSHQLAGCSRPLEQEVEVVLPREPDPAEDLERRGGHLPG